MPIYKIEHTIKQKTKGNKMKKSETIKNIKKELKKENPDLDRLEQLKNVAYFFGATVKEVAKIINKK